VSRLRRAGALAAAAVTAACAAAPPRDYAAFREHLPRSILVLPPLNDSPDVVAPYVWLSTITRPLAECGYYVFPVAVVDAFMKENGLPTAGEMHAVSLAKIQEVVGADAVLYVTVESWGQKYRIVSSDTVVRARARLVDVADGSELWAGTAFAQRSSAAGQTDPIGMLVAAVVEQIVASITDPAYELSRTANEVMVNDAHDGLLRGPRHPQAAGDVRGR
jgi:hypothetical protein